ncbi:hypothetical protein JHK82_049977 [Glycine max]|nr:hypothetical protein JHK86_049851 [Glycine max]KAG4924112.1 hypothetical protein JHK87_049652 [Glycine soja]KAG5091199.1 hypothetical protein JHK82_049977 [Glycine max]
MDVSFEVGSPVNGHTSITSTPNHRSTTTPNQVASLNVDSSSPILEDNEIFHSDKQYHAEDESVAKGSKDNVLLSSNSYCFGGSDNGISGNVLKNETLKNVRSVRSSADSVRNIGSLGNNHLTKVKENGVNGDGQKNGANIQTSDRKHAKVYPREARNGILDNKIDQLENKIKMVEGELREAATIEVALYSVLVEHMALTIGLIALESKTFSCFTLAVVLLTIKDKLFQVRLLLETLT